jgi:hypothetical protein
MSRRTKAELEQEIRELNAALDAIATVARRQQRVIDAARAFSNVIRNAPYRILGQTFGDFAYDARAALSEMDAALDDLARHNAGKVTGEVTNAASNDTTK